MKAATRLLFCLLISAAAFAQDSGKVFLVRHAEKQSDAVDTPLSSVGTARAECLARTLRDAHINNVLVTQYVRTQQTAEDVLRESRAHDPKTTDAQFEAKAYDKFVSAAKAGAAKGNALIVGHSNTIPALVAAFGGPAVAIADTDYDLLFIVDLQNPKRLTTLHYCPASPADATALGPNSMAKP